MILDEAIKMYTSNAEYERTHGSLQGCLDFRQLAEWLKELKRLREQIQPCTDAISRQAALNAFGLSENTRKYSGDHSGYETMMLYEIQEVIEDLPSVSTEKTDAYKQGWHDAIAKTLKETHSIHTEDGHFRVVQEETLIGVGMAYEQVSTENPNGCGDRLIDFFCDIKELINKYYPEILNSYLEDG